MNESHSATHILFDLDGTLVQTRVASWEVFRQVNAEFKLGVDEEEKYFALLTGNLFESIRQLCDTAEKADAAIKSFMNRLSTEYFPEMIPGMVDVIHALAPQSTLAVLSSNHTSVIRRVLTASGLEFCFAHVFGGDVEPDKTNGIRRFVADAAQGTGRQCSAFYNEAATVVQQSNDQTVLVTDTIGDVEAALAAGIRAVGVSWGMHSEAQLINAGAEFVAFWPQELVSYLRSDSAPDASSDTCTARSHSHSGGSALSDAVSIRVGRRQQATAVLQSRRLPHTTTSSPGSCGLEPAPVAVESNRVPSEKVPVSALPLGVNVELLEAIQRTMR